MTVEWTWNCDTCCDFVQATICSSDPDAPVLYFRSTALPPAEVYFRYSGHCYYIGSTGTSVMIPNPDEGDPVPILVALATGYEEHVFDDCTDCENNGTVDDDWGGWEYLWNWYGYGGGGWSWYWHGGGGWGWYNRPNEPFLVTEATLCSGYSPDPALDFTVFARSASIPVNGTFFSYGQMCFSVPYHTEGNTYMSDELGGSYKIVNAYPRFDDCSDCKSGGQAELCDGQSEQEGYDDLPEVWVPARRIPSDGNTIFVYKGFCWNIESGVTLENMPWDEQVVSGYGHGYETCSDCGWGYRVSTCPDQQWSPPVLYVKEDMVPGPGEDIMYFRVHAWCYYVDPDNLPTKRLIPASSTVIIPHSQYSSCADCICGVGEPYPCVLPVIPCSNNPGPSYSPNWYVRCKDVGADTWQFFEKDEACWYVNPHGVKKPLPIGGILISPSSQFEDCLDCGDTIFDPRPLVDPIPPLDTPPWDPDPDSSVPPDPLDDPPDDEPEGPETSLPPFFMQYAELHDCVDDTKMGYVYVSWELLGILEFPNYGWPLVLRINNKCYSVGPFVLLVSPPLGYSVIPTSWISDGLNSAECVMEYNNCCWKCSLSCVGCDTIETTSPIIAVITFVSSESACDGCDEEDKEVLLFSDINGCTWDGGWAFCRGESTISLECVHFPTHLPEDYWEIHVVIGQRDGEDCPDMNFKKSIGLSLSENGYLISDPDLPLVISIPGAGTFTIHIIEWTLP